MVVLVTCKNEDLIKTGGARVFATLFITFSDVQWLLTPYLNVESGLNSNSSKLLWMFLLPARIKTIQSKNKGAGVFTTFLPL